MMVPAVVWAPVYNEYEPEACGGWWNCLSSGEQVTVVGIGAGVVIALVAIIVFRPRKKGDK